MATVLTVIVIIWFHIWTVGYSSSTQPSSNPLNGQHLRVIWPLWSGNPKGLAGPLKGGVVLDVLANRFNFTYEMVRVTENRFEPPENGRGLFSYLFDQQCDLLIHDVAQTFKRQKIIDMTVPWIYSGFTILIPVHDDAANVNAVIKPFQWPVWIGLVISIAVVTFVLTLMQRYLAYRSLAQTNSTPKQSSANQTVANQVTHCTAKEFSGTQYLYVLGNLLSQGVRCESNRLSLRLVAGVWCLAAFVFVQAYMSTLITYVVTPINLPLINSVYDIPDKQDINVLIRKAGLLDYYFSDSNRTLITTLRDRINSYPKSRCAQVADCLNLLTPGSKNVFIDGSAYIMDAIREDFKKTGKCNLQLARDGFSNALVSFALPKNSKFTKTISLGMLELMQTGIIDHWDLWFRPMPRKCMGNIRNAHTTETSKTLKQKNHPPSLSLKNLTGAFVVLSVGFSISLLVFLCELIIAMPSRNRRRLDEARNKIETEGSKEIQDVGADTIDANLYKRLGV